MRPSPMTGKILQHLETLTRYRDTSLLKVSLMNTMLSLTRIDDVHLYDVLEGEAGYLLALSAWSEKGEVRSSNDLPQDDQVTPVLADSPIAQALSSLTTISTPSDAGHKVCIPIVLGEKPYAIFEFIGQQAMSENEQDVLDGIIGVFRNYLDLLRDSQHDTLTGLLNRKTFEQGFAGLLAAYSEQSAKRPDEQRQAGNHHWLAVIDIDFFKRINDNFGHLYGDEVLILMANLMRRSFRRHDRLYRFGGEEFVVLMRNVGAEGVRLKLEQFRQAVASYAFPQVGQVTISIGFSSVAATDTPSEVIGKADEALYFAKDHGRNQVCGYEDLIASGDLAVLQNNQDAEFF
ncbi:MAG: GGDEF domain-containing protein [Nitrosomonadales bacterium]|nr:GGDEF domain-containing protein [Nitrosomonadales bacterium]